MRRRARASVTRPPARRASSRAAPRPRARVGGREVAHVRARLVAPDPDAARHPRRAPRATASSRSGTSSRRQPERGHPELGHDAVARRGLGEERRVACGRTARPARRTLPVRVGREDVDAGERRDRVPVAHAVRALDRGQQADRVAAAAARTCAVSSPRKSTSDASRNASTSSVSSRGKSRPKRSRQTSHVQLQRAASSTPTCPGTTQCGSSQKTRSAPASSAASAHSLQKAR